MKIAPALNRVINNVLNPFGLELRRFTKDRMDMDAALDRINLHHFGIQTVIDIGAAQGNWTKLALKSLPDCNYLMIEPLKEREEALKALSNKHPKVRYALCVAGENDGESASLNVSSDLDGSTVSGTGGEQRPVNVRSIDALLRELDLPGPYLIKFDTHGYELPILRGAANTLQDTQAIIMECYNFQFVPQAMRFHNMCAHMETLGFRTYDLAGPSLRKHDAALWQMDFFFARNGHEIFKTSSYS
jgi:FkbM family methyltransferase